MTGKRKKLALPAAAVAFALAVGACANEPFDPSRAGPFPENWKGIVRQYISS